MPENKSPKHSQFLLEGQIAATLSDQVLRRYLVLYQGNKAHGKKSAHLQKKRRHINAVALALQERPDLAESTPLGPGRGGRIKVRSFALQAYLLRHRGRLEDEARKIRESTPAASVADVLPADNKQWLEWLENNFTYFHDTVLKDAPLQRRELNKRMAPSVAFGRAKPEPPVPAAALPPWTDFLNGLGIPWFESSAVQTPGFIKTSCTFEGQTCLELSAPTISVFESCKKHTHTF